MSDWVHGKPQIATEKDLQARWGCKKPGEDFYCRLCGHKFKVGDYWRFQYGGNKAPNILVCENCDGPDVLDRAAASFDEAQGASKRWNLHFSQHRER